MVNPMLFTKVNIDNDFQLVPVTPPNYTPDKVLKINF